MQFKFSKFATVLIASGIISIPLSASANDSTELEELRGLVQELSQQVKILARKGEVAEEDATAAKKTTPVVKASANGFGLESADGKNSVKFSGLLQADYRSYQDGANDVRGRSNGRAGSLDDEGFHDANDTALLRRIRPTIQGTLFGKYDFRFTPDFAGGSATAVDAYLDARFDPAFKIRAGKYKPFVGLERLQSGGDLKFVERSYVTNAILPNRDVGISLYGDILGDKLAYAVGVNNGVVDGGNASTGTEFDGSKEVTARLFATPFKDDINALSGLGFGIAGTYTNIDGEKNLNFTDTSAADATRNGLPSYVTNGQQTFFRYGGGVVADGNRTRIAPQANYYYGPFGLITEYARVSQEVSKAVGGSPAAGGALPAVNGVLDNTSRKLKHDAWEVAASYLITGEDASFKGVKPKNDFDLDKGGWGAWELVARYSEINLDNDTFKNANGVKSGEFGAGSTTAQAAGLAYADASRSAKSAKSWTAGVNWYLNQNAKIQLNYEHTKFDGGALAEGLAQATNANATGSNVRDRESEDAILARFQVAF
ncbi:porin [Flavobacterium sp.]|uniref:OprO/OprP family phosphate-selective porin n=1 Tax=Flavobacterium sp. TaxID=239 RepID=UPI002869F256|nr:porin [Flavobacterium sp.]